MTERCGPGAGEPAPGDGSAQWRESGRYHQHVLLLEHHTGLASSWRPDALGPRLLADRETRGRVLVGPDVDPFVETAQLRVPRANQWRQFDAFADLRAPPVD